MKNSDDWRAQKLEQAREKYGRPFLFETPVARKTPPSYKLEEINLIAAQEKKTNIITIRKTNERHN